MTSAQFVAQVSDSLRQKFWISGNIRLKLSCLPVIRYHYTSVCWTGTTVAHFYKNQIFPLFPASVYVDFRASFASLRPHSWSLSSLAFWNTLSSWFPSFLSLSSFSWTSGNLVPWVFSFCSLCSGSFHQISCWWWQMSTPLSQVFLMSWIFYHFFNKSIWMFHRQLEPHIQTEFIISLLSTLKSSFILCAQNPRGSFHFPIPTTLPHHLQTDAWVLTLAANKPHRTLEPPLTFPLRLLLLVSFSNLPFPIFYQCDHIQL